MPRSFVILIFLVTGPLVGQQGPLPARPEAIGLSSMALARITAMLQSYVDSGRVTGAVAMVARKGRIGYWQAVGRMDRERNDPMRTDGVFRIFSMTKPIVAAAALKLAEDGKLRLYDPVAKFIPAFSATRVFAGGSASHPALNAPIRAMTVEHLLTHTAGLTYGIFGQSPVDSIYNGANLMTARSTLAGFADSLARLPLLFSPGERWNYSMGIDLLGRVVEVASGKPLDQYLDQALFRPLGMTATSFHRRADMDGRIPTLYTLGATGKLDPAPPGFDESYEPTSEFLSGGGGLLSTQADYVRFAQMLLNGGTLDGRRVLQRGTVARMMQNHLPPSLTPLSDPIIGHEGYGHGLGGVVLVDASKAGLPGAPGIFRWWGYAGTFFWVDPKTQLIGMVWTQLVPGRAFPLEQDFQRLAYAALLP